MVQGTKRLLGNLHVSNKPNKEPISINKSILIGLREALAWGPRNIEELHEEKRTQISDILLPETPLTPLLQSTPHWLPSHADVFVSVPCSIHWAEASPLPPPPLASPPAVPL